MKDASFVCEREHESKQERGRLSEFMSLMKGYLFWCYSTVKNTVLNNLSV